MTESLDRITHTIFGKTRSKALGNKTCVVCGSSAEKFKDEISRKEFSISGMCQDCQDKVFG